MKRLGIGFLIILIITTLCAASAQAAQVSAEPSTPFLIHGSISYENGSECNYPVVNVTNINSSNEWAAERNENSNYYQIILASDADLIAGETLQFNVTSPDENQWNITEHIVTQSEVDAGGFEYNITLALSVLTYITVSPELITLNLTETQTFTASPLDQYGNPITVDITWSSSNTSVGTIDASGLFTAVAEGTALVNATNGSVVGTASVTVNPASPVLTSITVSPESITLNLTETQTFTASPLDQYGNPITVDITWSSSNTSVGTIEASTGLFTAVAEGTALVNATNGSVVGTASVTVDPALEIDLIVESITPNCGYLFGNESNNISAVVKNNGSTNAGESHASFVLSDGYSKIVSVSSLNAGASTTVTITDPTIRNASDSVTITVTSDCNTEVSESNETNNVIDLGPITVVNNGYKGKTYTGGPNMTTWKTYDLHGNLVYSAGDSRYESGSTVVWNHSNVSWTASDLPIPSTSTVKEARLYVPYTYAKDGAMPNNYSMTFNGNPETFDVHYWDDKTRSYGTNYQYYGMLVYNVTANFSTNGNTANFTSLWSGLPAHSGASIRGMILVAMYEDANEPHRQIFVNEEFDMLYGSSSKCTTPEEATAWAPITGPAICN